MVSLSKIPFVVSLSKIPFVVSPSTALRTGLSNHAFRVTRAPFDRLRANGFAVRPW